MARMIELYNRDRSLCVEVAPDHGGMITQIKMGETEILHIDPGKLELTPMAAGGNPVLFPFANKTKMIVMNWMEKLMGCLRMAW